MTKEELAKQLNGREIGEEITEDEEAAAKAAGLVVVFGYSDDNMEFRGALDNEVGCYGGDTVRLTPSGLLSNECDEEDCPYFERMSDGAASIEAVWAKGEDGPSWTFETKIPHSTFDVMEGGEVFCCGIVFSLQDVPAPRASAR